MDYDIDISDCDIFCSMSKQKKHSDAGKGDKSRVINKKKFDKNWDKIFGKKIVKKIGNAETRKEITSVKKSIRYVYSSEDCKIDEDGGPYEIELSKLDRNNK